MILTYLAPVICGKKLSTICHSPNFPLLYKSLTLAWRKNTSVFLFFIFLQRERFPSSRLPSPWSAFHHVQCTEKGLFVSINTQRFFMTRNMTIPEHFRSIESTLSVSDAKAVLYRKNLIQFHASGRRCINGKISISCSNKNVDCKNPLFEISLPWHKRKSYFTRKI